MEILLINSIFTALIQILEKIIIYHNAYIIKINNIIY